MSHECFCSTRNTKPLLTGPGHKLGSGRDIPGGNHMCLWGHGTLDDTLLVWLHADLCRGGGRSQCLGDLHNGRQSSGVSASCCPGLLPEHCSCGCTSSLCTSLRFRYNNVNGRGNNFRKPFFNCIASNGKVIVNCYLIRSGGKWLGPILRYYLSCWLKGLRKIMKTFSDDLWT
jgi:hypothetical protein